MNIIPWIVAAIAVCFAVYFMNKCDRLEAHISQLENARKPEDITENWPDFDIK